MKRRVIFRLVVTSMWLSAAVLAGVAITSGTWRAAATAFLASPSAATVRRPESTLPRSFTPYTITLQETWSGADNVPRRGLTLTVAMRSDGTRSAQMERLDVSRPVSVRDIEFPLGDTLTANYITERFFIEEGGPYRATLHRDPSTDCLYRLDGVAEPNESVTGHEQVLGHRTAKISAGGATYWYAPAVSCALLRQFRKWDDGGTSDVIATSIEMGEPAAELFVVPNGFRRVSRDEYLRRD